MAPPPIPPPEEPHEQPHEQLYEQLHEQAFWIYGVIVGLSLGQAMKDVLPQVLPTWFLELAQPAAALTQESGVKWLELLRLIVFLMMITRFYLGSVVFFKKSADPGKSIDFFLGFSHFLFFFVWSLTLKSPPESLGLSGYLITLGIILLLDQVYRLSPSWKTKATAFVCGLIGISGLRVCHLYF